LDRGFFGRTNGDCHDSEQLLPPLFFIFPLQNTFVDERDQPFHGRSVWRKWSRLVIEVKELELFTAIMSIFLAIHPQCLGKDVQ
jgi:hypothetical protein